MIISSTEGRANAEEGTGCSSVCAIRFSGVRSIIEETKMKEYFRVYLANINSHFLSKQFYRNQFFVANETSLIF